MNKFFSYGAGVLLFLTVSLSAKDYNGAELFSNDHVKYGRFDIRMRSISGSAVISAFFTYYDDSYLGSPEPWGEIDIEIMGKKTNEFQSNIITGTAENKVTSEKMHTCSNLSETYNTYSIEWTPDYIAWFFNGNEVRRSTGSQVTACQPNEMSYRFNAWVTDVAAWGGAFDPSILPVYQFINWISYSEYTPGAGEGGSNFTPEWREDFDSFDSTRWSKGDWTFGGNMVDFSPENIVVQDGYCIIGITKAGQTGFSGTVPLDPSTSVVNYPAGSALTITPLRYAHQKKSFTVSLNGRLLSDGSQFGSGKLCPQLLISNNNKTAHAAPFLAR
jgi:endo-1,3-1,4-beta-glycanase ExoK